MWTATRSGNWVRVGLRITSACLIVGIATVSISELPAHAAPSTGVTSYTGTGIDTPYGIAWASDGALWFANYDNNSIGRITTSGTVSNYVSTAIDEPLAITAGADGALWFTNYGGDTIGRITTSGTVSTYPLAADEVPDGITAGPDGDLWFTNTGGNSIGMITPQGTVSNFTGSGIEQPTSIASGPDGALWFTNTGGDLIGRITTSGVVSEYKGADIDRPEGITSGPDGALWFTNSGAARTFAGSSIGRITTSGVVTNYTDSTIDDPQQIVAGPDGALWFTNGDNNSIGRITTGGSVTNFTDPSINGPFGITTGPDGALWFTNSGGNSIGRIITQGAVTADGSATCAVASGQTTFDPPLTTSASAESETATTTISLPDCDQQDNSNIPGSSAAAATVAGSLTSTTTYDDNSCATFLAGGASTATVDWTATPAPTDGVAPTTLTSTGTVSADDQSPSGDLGIQLTGASATGSYVGPSSMTFFGDLTRAQFISGCAGTGGVSTLTIANGVVSAGMTVSGPAITSAPSATFTEGIAGSFAVTLNDALTSDINCVGNLPPGVMFISSPNGGGGQLSGTPLPGSAGTYPLTIVGLDSSGESDSQPFTLTVAASTVPYVTGVSPRSGTNSPVSVTITGENLGGDTAVDFGTIPATDVTNDSSTSITVQEPVGTVAGPVDVRVTTPSGLSVATAADQFTFDLAPEPPSVVSADPEGLGMFVSWVPNPTSDDVTSYTATASVAAGYAGTVPSGCEVPVAVTVPGTDSAADITGLCAGVPYAATVTATNAYGTSGSSVASTKDPNAGARSGNQSAAGSDTTGEASNPVVPDGALAPSEPLITSVLARKRSLIVSWNPPPQDGGDPLHSYQLTASAAGETTVEATVPATDTQTTVKKLVDGVTYTVTLTASSAAGTSDGDTSTGTPKGAIAPEEPAGMQVEPDGHGNLVATWSPPTDAGTKPLKGYVLSYTVTTHAAPRTVLRSGRKPLKGTPGTIKLKSKVTSYTLSGLSPDSYYNVSLVAVTAAGTSPALTTNDPVTPDVTLNPGTIELTSGTEGALASDVGGVLTWPAPVPSQLSGLKAGDVLAGAPTTALPQGLLAQVQSVYPTAAGGITAYTSDASPSQAFLTFTYSMSGSPPSGPTNAVRAMTAGVTTSPHLGIGAGSSGSESLSFGNCGGDDVSACLDGSMFYALDAGANLDTFCVGATAWGVCFGIPVPDGVTLYADAEAGANASVAFDINETQQYQLIDDIVGAIPIFLGIVLTPEVIVDLDLSGSLAFRASVGATLGGGVNCYATLVDGAGCNTTSPGEPISFPPTGSATASVNGTGTATLDAELALCVDVIACTNVTGDLSLTGTINTSSSPYLSICAALSVSLGVNLNLIIHNFTDDVQLFTTQLGCSSQASPPPTLAVSANGQSPGSCAVPLGTNIQQLAATRSDGQSDPPITWQLENGIPGDSISSTGELTTASPGGRTLTIKATDATGLSGVLKCSVGTETAFTAPTGLTFSQAFLQVGPNEFRPLLDNEEISWQPPVNDGGATVDKYRICLSGVSATHCYDTAGTSYVVSDFLDPGTAVYGVQVWAINTNNAASPVASGSFTGLGGSISNVTIGPLFGSEAVTISGAGFGNAPTGTASAAGCGATGSDYTNNALVFRDVAANGTTWTAGTGSDCIGLDVLQYSDTEVGYAFGSFYGSQTKDTVQLGQTVTVTVNGIQDTTDCFFGCTGDR